MALDLLTVILMIASLQRPDLNVNRQEAYCLSENIYYEARGEPITGQIAVAYVTLNRAKLTHASICDTVYAPSQFSWTLQPKPRGINRDAWKVAVEVAVLSMVGYLDDPTLKSTHYYNPYKVSPRWASAYPVINMIGNHVFLRDAGFRAPRATVMTTRTLSMTASARPRARMTVPQPRAIRSSRVSMRSRTSPQLTIRDVIKRSASDEIGNLITRSDSIAALIDEHG
jgi:hypothetical protein